jgi:hypothetical protein
VHSPDDEGPRQSPSDSPARSKHAHHPSLGW